MCMKLPEKFEYVTVHWECWLSLWWSHDLEQPLPHVCSAQERGWQEVQWWQGVCAGQTERTLRVNVYFDTGTALSRTHESHIQRVGKAFSRRLEFKCWWCVQKRSTIAFSSGWLRPEVCSPAKTVPTEISNRVSLVCAHRRPCLLASL